MDGTTTRACGCAGAETDGKLKELEAFMDASVPLNDRQGMLMGVLHKTQDIFGYIPRQAVEFISEKLGLPTAHIYGMVTFYNYFSLKPKARYQIYMCKGTACYVAGGARVLERLQKELGIETGDVTDDGMFGLNVTRCLGCCGLSPVMQVNEDIYVRMVPERVRPILEQYRSAHRKPSKKGKKVGAFEHPGR